MSEAHQLVPQVSGDRLRHEIVLIFNEENVLAMLKRLDDLGLLNAIHPRLNWSDKFNPIMYRALHEEIQPEWKLPEKIGHLPLRSALGFLAWLAQYPLGEAILMSERLRLPGDIQNALQSIQQLNQDLPGLSDAKPSSITSRLDSEPPVALFIIHLLEPGKAVENILHRYITRWRDTWPAIDGNALRQMGLPPGPQYKEILSALRDAWLDGKVSSIEEENRMLQELAANHLTNKEAL